MVARAEARYTLTADDKTGPAFASVQARFRESARIATRVGAGIAAAGIGGFAIMAREALNAADETAKLSRELGVSTENLSEMRGVLELTGGSFRGYVQGIRRMQRSIQDFSDDSEGMSDAFERIGVSIDDLQGRSPEQQFDVITGALAQMEDITQRNATAYEIFGRSASDVLRLVDAGAENIAKLREEQRALGNSLQIEGAEGAEAFNDAMTRLNQTLRGMILQTVVDDADDLAASMRSIAELAGPVLSFLSGASRLIRGTGEFVGAVGAAGAAAARGEFAEAGAILNTDISELGAVRDATQEQTAVLREIRERVGPARAG